MYSAEVFTFVLAISHFHRNNDAFFGTWTIVTECFALSHKLLVLKHAFSLTLWNMLGHALSSPNGIRLNQNPASTSPYTVVVVAATAASAVVYHVYFSVLLCYAFSHLKLIMITFYCCYRWHRNHYCVFPYAWNWSFVLSIWKPNNEHTKSANLYVCGYERTREWHKNTHTIPLRTCETKWQSIYRSWLKMQRVFTFNMYWIV